MRNVLCYGDSNTWGYIPTTGERYPADVRWPGVMAAALGSDWRVWEDGISGRSTVWDEPFEKYRNGLTALGYALHRARPLDLVILMLGTNDLNYTDAYGYYKGLRRIAQRIINADACYPGTISTFAGEPRLLLVSPITLHPEVEMRRPEIHVAHQYEASTRFAAYTGLLAGELGVSWIDAATFAKASAQDCLHMEAEQHRILGQKIAEKVLALFLKES